MIDDPLNRLYVKRGSQLPQSRLTESDVIEIMAQVEQRDQLKERLRRMTNAALAEECGVHVRTVEKVIQGNSWTHVDSA